MTVTECSHNENLHLKKLSQGDEGAFRFLYDKYHKGIYYLAVKLLKSDSIAEDVLQEVYSIIWMNRLKMATVINFRKYINTIAINHIHNLLKRRAFANDFIREEILERQQLKSNGLDVVDSREMQSLLAEAILRLAPQQRRVFELSRIYGFKHDEIALQLNISKETVKKHCMRAVQVIKISLLKSGIYPVYLLFLFPI